MDDTGRKVSAFEARTHLGELMDYVLSSRQPCLIERHGRPVAALLDIESFKQTLLPQRYSRWLDEAVAQIKSAYRPNTIILFGSMAEGRLQEGSDIDLLIIKDTDKRRVERTEEVLALIDPEIPVEPHIYTSAELKQRKAKGDPFIKRILDRGMVLYDAEE